MVLFLGAIGTIITVKAQAKKTYAETDMIKAQQAQLHKGQEQIQAQFVNNGGSTLKDAVDLIKREVAATRSELAGIRKDVGRLAEVDVLDREISAKDNERFYKAIGEVQQELIGHIKEVPDLLKKHQEDTIKMIEGKLPCI